MSSLRVGLIGAGLQGHRRAKVLRFGLGERLVAVSDTNAHIGQRLSSLYQAALEPDWRNLINHAGIDAVIICTPSHLHFDMVKDLLNAGKHVLCEKPLALEIHQAETLVEIARERGLKLKCGFNHRHFPGIAQAKKWCDEGKLGSLLLGRCRHGIIGRPGYDKDWRAQPQMSGGGELMDQGFHAIDLFRWFFGEFEEVIGATSTYFWPIAPLEDNVFAFFKTSRGQVASLHNSWTQWKNLFSFEIIGTEGGLEVEGLGGSYGTQKLKFYPKSFERPFQNEVIEYRGDDSSFKMEWEEFADSIQMNREPLGNGQDGLESLKLVKGVYASAKSRSPVKMRELESPRAARL